MNRKLPNSQTIAQVVRFGIGGLLITVVSTATYWFIAEKLRLDPNLSLLIVYVVFSLTGFVLHSRWSFFGYGDRNRPFIRLGRYTVANLVSLAANQAFVWLLVKGLHGANWWPIVPMICVTPWLTFGLNRHWVFSAMR
jgi:putative flippase GtrA